MNNIELSAQVLAELFPASLVIVDEVGAHIPAVRQTLASAKELPGETPVADAISPDTAPRKWKTLGDNKKNILIAVNYPDVVYLPDEEFGFLTNMLGACKLSLADVSIINLYQHPDFVYKDLLNQLNSTRIFLFGIEPVDFGLPVNFPVFQVQSFSGATYLFAPSLEDNRNDKLLKSKLWLCLQRIFDI